MSGPRKTYVIDPVSQKDSVEMSSSSGDDRKELPEYLQPSGSGVRRGHSKTQTNDKQSGISLLLSYFAGPLYILATRRGRRNKFWAGLSIFSVILSIIVVWMWGGLSSWSTRENPVGAIMLLGAVVAILSGVSAWTRAVILAGRFEGPRLRRVPRWIKGPLATGLFGIICPGMGLFVAGRSKHAVAAMWMASLTAISLLYLSRAFWLWNFNAYAGAFALKPDTLEYVFIIASVVAVLGGLVWIAQALNGVRLAGRVSSRKPVYRRNWIAVALLTSIIAFSTLSRPALVAEALDTGAAVSSSEGMRIIPLYLSMGAIHFDPSKPDYTIRAIELYEHYGDQVTADMMRRDLVDLLESSVPLLEEEGIVLSKTGNIYGALIDEASIDARIADDPEITKIPEELLVLDWDRQN
ncbi:MAG: hypothetical protein KOO63_12350 [Bacteroidales bacterium]|nr:hypothetical protein [Candidatus Latescibacterota bacterium]